MEKETEFPRGEAPTGLCGAMTLGDISRRLAGRSPRLQDVTAEYAVLVPLVEGEGGLSLLFEVRAGTLRRQPGEICFPGGRVEKGETPAACALRETVEELGISPTGAELLAPLDCLGHQSGFLMHPFLGKLDAAALAGAPLNPAEVAEVFTVPLDFFLGTEPEVYRYALVPDASHVPVERLGFPQGYPWRGGRVEVPVYRWKGRIIWGLTGRVVRNLARLLREG